jgi:hypothetical protein
MQRRTEMDDKFIHAATADYEALYKDRDMILYLAELLLQLHECDPENYHIDAHWSLQGEEE